MSIPATDPRTGPLTSDVVTRIRTGNPQADSILGGGFPSHSINVIMGQPGTGKTVFAEQLLYHNARGDRPVLYVTTLSEPMSKVVRYAQGFRFFEVDLVGNQIQYEDLGELLGRDGPAALSPWLADAIKTIGPRILVIDSFRSIHDLEQSSSVMRRMVSEVAGLLSAYEVTTFLVGEYTASDIDRYPEFAVADGVVEFARQQLTTRDERFFRVLKLRGSGYREGQHAFRITDAGIDLYPRLVGPPVAENRSPPLSRVSTGVEGLDAMLDGGLWSGSTTLLVGGSGAGKTTIATQFALDGVRGGSETLFVNFQERPEQLRRVIAGLGADPHDVAGRGLRLLYVSPVELQIDSVVVEIFRLIQSGRIRRLVIDSAGDLASAASDQLRFHDYLYALVQHLGTHGITTVLTLESTTAITGRGAVHERISSLSDNVIILERVPGEDIDGVVRVIKTRNSAHERLARPFVIGSRGASVR